MKESFHYMLMVTQAVFHKKLLTGLQGTGLTLGQPKVLDYLREHDGSNQKAIAAACHIEPASLTSVLGGMEQKGLIERKPPLPSRIPHPKGEGNGALCGEGIFPTRSAGLLRTDC